MPRLNITRGNAVTRPVYFWHAFPRQAPTNLLELSTSKRCQDHDDHQFHLLNHCPASSVLDTGIQLHINISDQTSLSISKPIHCLTYIMVNWTTYTRTKRFRFFVAFLTITVILAITIPLAAFFIKRQQHRTMAPRSNLLVPLYVYPAPGAWSPLHDV